MSPVVDIIIADDHPVVLAGVEKTIEACEGRRVVAVAQSIGGLFDALRLYRCDIVVSDFSFCGDPEPDGLMMLERLSRSYPHVKIIVLSQHDDLVRVKRIMTIAAGFVSKTTGIACLPDAIDEVLQGCKFVDTRTAKLLLGHMFERRREGVGDEPLTMREMEVMRLYSRGMTVTEIAHCTRRSLKTISAQKQSAMKKLGARTDVELIDAFKIAGGVASA
ncbi:response regulator transcription factor [Pararobbsia silviterrae]|nr:response regulator transcription factor [Pararobbsia silviterrae]